MVNIDPPDDLPDHHTKDYRGAYQECIISKKADFDKEGYKEDLEAFIDQEEEHRRLINFCIFPFAESSPQGYRFIRADPLQECGVKNFDFLLHDLEGRVIFGEAKASLPTNVGSVINDIVKQREEVENNREYIESNYLGKSMDFAEFVLATYDNHASKASRKILSRGENIKVWSVNRTDKEINLIKSLPDEMPDGFSSENPIEELSRLATHSIGKLNSELENRDTATGTISILPKTADVDQLRVITRGYSSEGRNTYINQRDIYREVESGARNYERAQIEEISDSIVDLGKEIGLLCDWDDAEADYKVVSQYTSRQGIEKTLKKKWVKYKIEQEYQKLQQKCREYAREKVGEQKQISDFPTLGNDTE